MYSDPCRHFTKVISESSRHVTSATHGGHLGLRRIRTILKSSSTDNYLCLSSAIWILNRYYNPRFANTSCCARESTRPSHGLFWSYMDTFVWLGIWDINKKKGSGIQLQLRRNAGLCEWRPKTPAEKGEWIHSQERGRSFIALHRWNISGRWRMMKTWRIATLFRMFHCTRIVTLDGIWIERAVPGVPLHSWQAKAQKERGWFGSYVTRARGQCVSPFIQV